MSNNELHKTLEKLHEELARNPALDEETLEAMRGLLYEIQAAISRSNDRPFANIPSPSNHNSPLSLTDRLQEMILGFETRHPQLTVTLSQIADRLNDMGI